jgi:hypothetical protein
MVVPTIAAQGPGGLTYSSGFQVQNLSDTNAATIVVTYYDKTGAPDTTINDTIPASSSVTYFPIDATAGFDGSVVISSDQPVAAIVNVITPDFSFAASYDSFSAGASTVSLPLIMKENSGFSTWFNVQNTGSADATVNITYAGTACTDTGTIAPGAAATFDQSINGCLVGPYVGAATIDAGSGSVVATVVEVGSATLFAYNGFTGGSAGPIIPLVNANNSGFITGIQVQNAGATDTDVTITYTPVAGLGTACSETGTVPAGGSNTFALFAFSLVGGTTTDDCADAPAVFVGSASITQTGAEPLVGIVNQLNLATNKASSYNAFDPASASDTVVMPLIMDRNSGFYTGFNLQVVSGGDLTISCTYTGTDNAGPVDVTVDVTATDGVANQIHALGFNPIGDGFVGAGSCTASEPFVGVVNELGALSGDVLFSYEGFNN